VSDFYVIRHGSTDLNERAALKGWLDPALSETGRKQAARLSGHFSAYPITRILASDLERAAVTAAVIAGPHALQVELTEGLRPINYGDLQGRPIKDVQAELDGLFHAWKQDPTVICPGGESFADFQDRTFSFFTNQVSAAAPDDCVVLVTHGRTARYIAAVVLNGGKPLVGDAIDLLTHIDVETGNYINVAADGRLVIDEVNSLDQIDVPEADAADTTTKF
jgi:broad specificity phosphatase PhoE